MFALWEAGDAAVCASIDTVKHDVTAVNARKCSTFINDILLKKSNS
jgi:hypothetical protein